MKRLFAVLGVLAVLSTLFVMAAGSPAAAGDKFVVQLANTGKPGEAIVVTGSSVCVEEGEAPPTATITAPPQFTPIYLDSACNDWILTAVDAAGRCTVDGEWALGPANNGPYNTAGPFSPNDPAPEAHFWLTVDCVLDPTTIDLHKLVPEEDYAAGAMTTWQFDVQPWTHYDGFPKNLTPRDDGACGEATTIEGVGSVDDDEPLARLEVPSDYLDVEANMILDCATSFTEIQQTGWTLDNYNAAGSSGCNSDTELVQDTVVLHSYTGDLCSVNFYNSLDPIPLTVTKTFTGREYYTTVDRADFHLYIPGLCGAFPIDPFGGLLGSVGVFRTINASQLPQVVMVLPDIFPASGAGACVYRVQENNAPEGCVAVDPDGSTADGPYWEKAWAPGVTELTFNIVNDCAEPTPEPTVAPTTAPKKPAAKPGAKKPSGGGTAAPKFTG